MLKKYLPTIIITSVLVLLPIIFGLIVWDKLPEQVPTHFGPSGEADGWSSKAFAVFGTPLMMLGVHLFCAFVSMLDPKRKNFDGKAFGLVLWVVPVMSILMSGVVLGKALGMAINITTVVMIVIGIMFILLGNYLPKVGQNYTVGIKVAWALNDPENWAATHRFGGKVFMVTGVVAVAVAFLSNISSAFIWVYLAIDTIAVFLPVIYSYLYYRKHGTTEEE